MSFETPYKEQACASEVREELRRQLTKTEKTMNRRLKLNFETSLIIIEKSRDQSPGGATAVISLVVELCEGLGAIGAISAIAAIAANIIEPSSY